MEKKFIIIYSECLRSKIIYQKFIEKNPNKIKAIIKIPNYPTKKNNISFINKLLLSSKSYLFFLFIQFFIYNLISFSFETIAKIAKRKNIFFLKHNSIPSTSFLKKNLKNFKHSDILLCSTMHILKKKNIYSKNIILNFHEAPLPKYRGSALYFHMKVLKEKKMHTCIMQPSEFIDVGKIELNSKSINIRNLRVFQIALRGYFLQSELIFQLLKKKIKKKIVIDKNKNKFFSFPKYQDIKDLNITRDIFNFKDIYILFKIMFSKTNKYKNILQQLNSDKMIENKH